VSDLTQFETVFLLLLMTKSIMISSNIGSELIFKFGFLQNFPVFQSTTFIF